MSWDLRIYTCMIPNMSIKEEVYAVKKTAAKSKLLEICDLSAEHYTEIRTSHRNLPIPDGYEDFILKNNIPFAYPGMTVGVNGQKGWIIKYSSEGLMVLINNNEMVAIDPIKNITYYDKWGVIVRSYQNGKMV